MTILLIIGIILLVFWILSRIGKFLLGGLIHIALVVGVILVILWLLRTIFKLF